MNRKQRKTISRGGAEDAEGESDGFLRDLRAATRVRIFAPGRVLGSKGKGRNLLQQADGMNRKQRKTISRGGAGDAEGESDGFLRDLRASA
ncbi:MAG: hypothetical protein CO071_02445 [Gallionellales bacterium CG_4_9_14_0_8_um_filter_59_50]|nr:MAG: hypothetical protein COT19_01995 [Gallionellales bacterium CG08_land_8_20_14_0_20_59_87]PJC02569.1 MAG: hypothetical protein CO071_02445 [Gallionellales bacterium CG_4_9_14_0_8_um_filter_59_50]